MKHFNLAQLPSCDGLTQSTAECYGELKIGQAWCNQQSGDTYVIESFLVDSATGAIVKTICRNVKRASFIPRVIGVERFGVAYHPDTTR